MSGYQYLAGVAAAALGTMSPNGPERLARLVRRKGVRDRGLLEAIASVPRAGFVPAAYSDVSGPTRDQPILIGRRRRAVINQERESRATPRSSL
jgi:protein-L-isoaspartate O-methyltransferase